MNVLARVFASSHRWSSLPSISTLVITTLLLLAYAPAAGAQNGQTATLDVRFNVLPDSGGCSIRISGAVVYTGSAQAMQAFFDNRKNSGNLVVDCVQEGTRIKVAADAGRNSRGQRRRAALVGGSGHIEFTLSWNKDEQTPNLVAWGDRGYGNTFSAGDPVDYVATGSRDPLHFKIDVPTGHLTPPGTYTDTILFTIHY